MAKKQEKQGEWSSFFAIVLLFCFVAALLFVPTKVLENTWQEEQLQMHEWAGDVASQQLLLQTSTVMLSIVKDANKSTGTMGNNQIETWLADRIYAWVHWFAMIVYRLYSLLMWSLIGIPFLMAACADGYYVREIRKTSFTSQSPIRHKIGVHFSKMVTLAMTAWLCLPIKAPIFAAPMVIFFMALSMWLWLGNLQKRL